MQPASDLHTHFHVTANSKEVKPGSIFFALSGARVDGYEFIPEALKHGAAKVYAERPYPDPKVEVPKQNIRQLLGSLASEMWGHPSHHLKMMGVTGTAGKTTTTYLAQHLFNSAGHRCARLGTNGGDFEGHFWNTPNTTPDALSIQAWLARVLAAGATHVVMEVSSHALDQERVWGIAWDSVCFLNLSHEHLDYHPNLEAYFQAKRRLFTDHIQASRDLGKAPRMFCRSDHPFGHRLLQEPGMEGYSVREDIKLGSDPTSGTLKIAGQAHPYRCSLYGNFQAENILAAVRVVESFGIQPERILNGLATFEGVPGRMEAIPNDQGLLVFVDYAHKPEALEKVLLAVQQPDRPVITVFGCGGDRDRSKRPLMGEIAARLSHRVIVTSDNPRTEDAQAILNDIVKGMGAFSNYEVMPDRRAAIRAAIKLGISLKPQSSLIVIAGKGHEDYQIIGTTKHHFDDREEARAAIAAAFSENRST
jgi:UDP-N-acetylmuramoyl-L-alanyl-D-glutamate--2,6-diaminopimelate ligase